MSVAPRAVRIAALFAALATAAPLPAQSRGFRPPDALPPAPPVVAVLPGFGRPVDVEATRERRRRLLERLGDAVVLVPAAHERDIEAGDYPQDNDFRQHNTFFYLTMLETARAWVLLHARTDGPDEEILLLPPRDPRQERWTGVRLGAEPEAMRLSGFPRIEETARLADLLAAARARRVPFYVPLDPTTRHDEVVARLRADTAEGLDVRNLRPIVDSMRQVKDAAELAALRRAVIITANAHTELMREARDGMAEYELEAIIEAAFRRQGADRVGYPSIVGSGFNATTLHYDVNRAPTRPGDLVVVDAGAEWGQYTADVTRTFPISGRFTPRQRALYDLVLGAQQAAMDAVRPGVTIRQLTQIARAYLREHSGALCPAQPGERLEGPATCDRYMIHGLSHWIGMDVHDVGPYGRPLEPGMVFTIEPGIYIPAESLGIRIEDCVLVTETGYELLSGNAPRRAEEVEQVMAAGRAARARGGRR
jgi:Xaa-Pro aminopeptidase